MVDSFHCRRERDSKQTVERKKNRLIINSTLITIWIPSLLKISIPDRPIESTDIGDVFVYCDSFKATKPDSWIERRATGDHKTANYMFPTQLMNNVRAYDSRQTHKMCFFHREENFHSQLLLHDDNQAQMFPLFLPAFGETRAL
jgi:hypothetical protein